MENKSASERRQVIGELRHQLRFASPQERDRIRQELNFWEMRGR
ncbi:hypothetical protein [Nodosilinea sp. LEGE 06152]|nr:hypothetical protein [Nodosilinea sp. LEGE 06152]